MQTYLRPASLNVDLVRRNFDFCVFFGMAVVNSATVIFGAKMAVKDEILNVYKLADSQNPFSALPI